MEKKNTAIQNNGRGIQVNYPGLDGMKKIMLMISCLKTALGTTTLERTTLDVETRRSRVLVSFRFVWCRPKKCNDKHEDVSVCRMVAFLIEVIGLEFNTISRMMGI